MFLGQFQDGFKKNTLIVRNVNVRFNPLGQIFFFFFFFFLCQVAHLALNTYGEPWQCFKNLLCLANTKVKNIRGSFCCYR